MTALTANRYRIKSSPEREEYLEVLRRSETGYHVRIVRCLEGYESVTESFLENHLFEMCLQTRYLYEETDASAPMHHTDHAAHAAFSVA
jgi:hypothetical protein